MPKVLSLVGAKGGTLKTASVASIAHKAAQAGLCVDMVDADPQADLTSRSGFDRVFDPLSAPPVAVSYADEPSLALRLLRGGRSMEGADFAAAARQIARAVELGGDLVVIDTPPALGPLTTAAIAASDLVLVPAVPGKESLERINDVLTVARAHGNPAVRVMLTLVNRRSNLLQWMRREVETRYPGVQISPVIPFEMSGGEAALYETPVTIYAPRSHNAAAYREATDVVLGLMRLGARRRAVAVGAE
jgi:chromosome partitioning protein